MNNLIIFDLDGTLFESREMHFIALNNALELRGYPTIKLSDHLSRFDGLPTRVKLQMLGIEGISAEEVLRVKQQHTLAWIERNVRTNRQFMHLFADLRTQGWQVAVASNAVGTTVVRALQLLGLWKLCNFIVAGDQVTHPKPDPEMYRHCMEACNAVPATTWAIEDSQVGFDAAHASGAEVCKVVGPHEVVEIVRSIMEEV